MNQIDDSLVPDERAIFGWIETVFARGVRRPGYAADLWAEQFCRERFEELGLERVRLEPVTLPFWEPLESALIVRTGGRDLHIPCFSLPHSAPADGLDAPLIPWRDGYPEGVRGAIALVDVPLIRSPADLPLMLAGGDAADSAWRRYDPDNTLVGAIQVLPFSSRIMAVMDAPAAAGAAGFVGVLSGFPGNSYRYYVPYDGVTRAIPGVWIAGSDGESLARMCTTSEVRAMLINRTDRHEITSHNVIGELPGADDECVIIGSHHDGPWSSAVEDASGIAMVLAQAAYWSRVERKQRPHRMIFLLNAGHMAGGAGVHAFIDRHRSALDRVVLEVHLEHAAREFVARDGGLTPSGRPEPRWWFTSRIARLETAVRDALAAERLERSLILPPEVFGPAPTTDGGPFHLAGVPLVNFLTAPFYLFDAMDTMDKIHRESLVPVTRAAIRIIASTAGVDAVEMRSRARAI